MITLKVTNPDSKTRELSKIGSASLTGLMLTPEGGLVLTLTGGLVAITLRIEGEDLEQVRSRLARVK